MKKIISLFLIFALVFSFAACSKPAENNAQTETQTQQVTVKLAALKGPTGMGMAKLITDDGKSENPKYEVTLSSAPEDLKAGVLKGDFDIAAMPTNLAAVLFNKAGADISVLAVNTLSVLYILEDGNTVNSVKDLAGKKLYATGQASTPEYILNYILKNNGVDPEKDVEIEYLTEHSELAAQMASGTANIGMLPEPNVTTTLLSSESDNMRIALDLTKEWQKINPDTEIMQGCIVVNNSFLSDNPEAVKAFMDEYKASVDFVNNNIEEAAKMCEQTGIVPKAAVALKAIPNCNITFVTGEEMKTKLSAFLGVLLEADSASVGGKLPADAFYYIEK